MKPVCLTWYGGKQRLAQRIVNLIPQHTVYLEPFAGGAAVFFTKEPSQVEIINDLNGELINFYQVLKTKFRKLNREIQATLQSRLSHQTATIVLKHPELFDPIKRAWAVWVSANQSFGSLIGSGSWRMDVTRNVCANRVIKKKREFTKQLAERLENTQIECRDALYLIQSVDSKNCFMYIDPPYWNSNMGTYGKFVKEYSKEDFIKLLDVLSNIKGKFLLSSYPSVELLEYTKKNGWHTIEIESSVSVHLNRKEKPKAKTEVLTANYDLKNHQL